MAAIHAVKSAFVSLIKLQLHGVSIDLLYAKLDLDTVPEALDLGPNSILRGLDEQSARIVNGRRVTEFIFAEVS